MTQLRIKRLNGAFGAEVLGLDLKKAMKIEVKQRINQALLKNLVLVIRNQALTPLEFQRGISNFGRPMLQHQSAFRLPECPDVSRVVNREKMQLATMWHTDHTNHQKPPKATVLYARKLPVTGGETCFANMYDGFENLSDKTKAAIQNLYTINNMEQDLPTYSIEDRIHHDQGARHPIVRTHPETGKKALYFHLTKVSKIEGMKTKTVRPFLENLLKEAIKGRNIMRHHWTLGDVVICDNRCVMHRANSNFDQTEERLLWRIILKGDKPS